MIDNNIHYCVEENKNAIGITRLWPEPQTPQECKKKKEKLESDLISQAFIWVSGVLKCLFFLSLSLHSDQIQYLVITNLQSKKTFGFKVTKSF